MKKALFLIGVIILCNATWLRAQPHLTKTITVDIHNQSLKDALIKMGNEGDFKFSYNSNSVPKDSIVSVYAENKKVLQVLRTVFNSTYDFKEVGNYVIIRKRAVATQNVVAKKVAVSEHYYITGYVVDEASGEKLPNTTIYEKINLLSTMTDDDGFFSLKLKKKYRTAEISVSRENYIDTTLHVVRNFDQKMTIALTEQSPIYNAEVEEIDSSMGLVMATTNAVQSMFNIKKTGLGRLLVSSKQKLQDLNLKRFYTTRTWQLSFFPPYSTHGRLNAQVVNRYSINILGGYSGGTDVFEMAGIYNMNKGDVKYFQAAGLINLVGGNLYGLQGAGIANVVQASVVGFQAAGIANVTNGHVKGAQVAGVFNKAKSINGIQIGLINIVTDKNTGSSLGLINISKAKNGGRRIGFIYRAPRRK